MRKVLLVLVLIFSCGVSFAQDEVVIDSLDFSIPSEKKLINDYSMIGISYGATFSTAYFNPTKHYSKFVFQPNYLSITYTKYSKMFDYLPYFGLVLGLAIGNEGYSFEANPQTGYVNNVDGATYTSMKVIEIPAMAQIHIDAEPFKIMALAGGYVGWRNSINRKGDTLDPKWANSFRDYEYKLDYGFQGGAGIALMFDPIEIHFNCLVRWSWSSLYKPNYASPYYYSFAYPIDIMPTIGIHFQLSNRRGRTRQELKQEAYNIVYGTPEDNSR